MAGSVKVEVESSVRRKNLFEDGLEISNETCRTKSPLIYIRIVLNFLIMNEEYQIENKINSIKIGKVLSIESSFESLRHEY